jgi:hypothetical protein
MVWCMELDPYEREANAETAEAAEAAENLKI